MNCDKPTIAIRKAGINPATNRAYKPHQFIQFRDDETFVRTFTQQSAIARTMEYEVLILPCTKCLLCIQAKRRMWACRCINESQVSNGGEFLTLTCSDDSLLRTFPGMSLDHRPFQLFMKRLRKDLSRYMEPLVPNYPLRFFMCGEYGEKSRRPHYHVLLFGWKFKDRRWVGRSGSGCDLWSCTALDELRFDQKSGLEIFGQVSNFSDISPYDISYTVGYVDKKLGRFDSDIYEKLSLKPEYVCMSRRPGIGLDWLKKWHGDVWKFYDRSCCCDFDELYPSEDLRLLHEGVRATVDFKYQVPRFYFDKAREMALLSQKECDTILSHRRGRFSEMSSNSGLLLESLKRAHDRCAIKEHELHVIKAPRQF